MSGKPNPRRYRSQANGFQSNSKRPFRCVCSTRIRSIAISKKQRSTSESACKVKSNQGAKGQKKHRYGKGHGHSHSQKVHSNCQDNTPKFTFPLALKVKAMKKLFRTFENQNQNKTKQNRGQVQDDLFIDINTYILRNQSKLQTIKVIFARKNIIITRVHWCSSSKQCQLSEKLLSFGISIH